MKIEYTVGEPLLKAENLQLGYGKTVVLDHVNFEILNLVRPGMTQGQAEVIIGPSGAGKTTLTRGLAGLLEDVKGEVLISNHNPEAPMRSVRCGEVGFVYQDYRSFAHLTVEKNLLLAAHQGAHVRYDLGPVQNLVFSCRRIVDWYLLRKKYKERVDGFLDMFDLRKHYEKSPSELSGGQKQRLAILIQVLTASQFIVMDEPFSGQDPPNKHKICKTLIKLATLDELKSFIIITHDTKFGAWIGNNIWPLGHIRDDKGNQTGITTLFPKIDMVERGLSWQDEEILRTPEFKEFVDYLDYELMPSL